MYDLIVVGGGIAGSSLAMTVAETGANVLVLEREVRFRDRVRGEAIHVWGTVDAKAIGVYDLLLEQCGNELDTFIFHEDGEVAAIRDFPTTTPSNGKELTLYHPDMQETLIQAAQRAGADVWRGATVTDVCPGDPPNVSVRHDGSIHTLSSHLVAGADGRRSRVRTWGGFETQRDPNNLFIAGALLSGLPVEMNSWPIFFPVARGWSTQFIPLVNGRYRSYFITGDRERHSLFGGKTGAACFVECALESGVPRDWVESMRFEGPIASFEGASWWVANPHQDGVVLIGDAAGATDPSFGSGLSMAMRDVHTLGKFLTEEQDWDAAAQSYAQHRDVCFSALRTVESWVAQAIYSIGPETQAIRDHARAAGKEGKGLDFVGRGPDQPVDEATRYAFLGY